MRLPEEPCYAALTPIECTAPGVLRLRARDGFHAVCERHARLVALKLEREGQGPVEVEEAARIA